MASEKVDLASSSSSALNDSWVELHYNSNGKATPLDQSSNSLERLLSEAQKESGLTSRNSSGRNSSNPLSSPPLSAASGHSGEFTRCKIEIPQQQINDWIWDWSSRPEAIPPSDYGSKFVRPGKRHPLSVRNTRVMKSSLLSSENLPTLFFSHACSFLVGATILGGPTKLLFTYQGAYKASRDYG